MQLIIKTFLKNLMEKKTRTFLVLFSIAISSALIFANQGFSLTCQQMFRDASVRWGGTSDIAIQPLQSVGAAEWIDTTRLQPLQNQMGYQVNFISQPALYMPDFESMVYYRMIGADINEFNTYNPITLISGSFDDWQGNKVIMGEAYAEKYGFNTGDSLTLEINGQPYAFTVAGISAQSGLFMRELADGGYLIAPPDTLRQIYGDQSNLIFIKTAEGVSKYDLHAALSAALPDYAVSYAVDDSVVAAEVANYAMPFNISAVAVIFMSMFIIYTAFNLISMARVSVIGALRSVGCSRKKVNALLLAESAMLGIIGGLMGCVLGLGILEIIKANYFTAEETIYNVRILLGIKEVLIAVGLSTLITVLSALQPILKTTRIPIKNILVNDLEPEQVRQSKAWVIGLVLMAACLGITPFLPGTFTGMILGCTLATGVLVGLVLVIPALVTLASNAAQRLPFISQETALGIRNVRDNHCLMNNIKLFAATIAIVAFMTTIFNSLTMDLKRSYSDDVQFDIQLELRQSDEENLAILGNTEGVSHFSGSHMASLEISNYGTWFNMLYGIEDASFFDFDQAVLPENISELVDKLDEGRFIITTNIMKAKFGIQEGDELVIRMNNQDVGYTVIGFVETNAGIGHVGFISADNYREDMGVSWYNEILIKADGDVEMVKNNIKRSLSREVMSINTKRELEIANADKVSGIFNSISIYTYIAMFVGIIGIINNIIAGFIERKRSFALYRCVGMSKKGIKTMLTVETALIGIFSVLFGLLASFIMMTTVPVTVSAVWGVVKVVPATQQILIMSAVSIVAMLLVSYVPTLQSTRLNIIETIKYE